MKSVIQLVITAIVCFALEQVFPWWTMALGAFMVGFVFSNGAFKSFLIGFAGVGLVWLGMALFINSATDALLTHKISQLLPVNVFVLTTVVGGLVGGFASMTGSLIKPSK